MTIPTEALEALNYEASIMCLEDDSSSDETTIEGSGAVDDRYLLATAETHTSLAAHHGAKHRKTVSFGDLLIRTHQVVLGDHPFCLSGCPMELSWEPEDEMIVSVDEFESLREPRKQSSELRTTKQERREILAKTTTDQEFKRHERKFFRERRHSREDIHAFFQADDS